MHCHFFLLQHGETAILGIRTEREGYEVATARGTVQAGRVIVGTNGYTNAADRRLRNRLVPVRSRIIATVPLAQDRNALQRRHRPQKRHDLGVPDPFERVGTRPIGPPPFCVVTVGSDRGRCGVPSAR
jgi:glycine/D-amino acid oxidase-like deaminating enzyme